MRLNHLPGLAVMVTSPCGRGAATVTRRQFGELDICYHAQIHRRMDHKNSDTTAQATMATSKATTGE